MKLLILGGTIFLGRHVVDAAIARGHDVTLFHRGQHNPDLFPDVPKILGDRKTDLDRLGEGRWDAVLDTSGYVPRVVRESAEFLADRTDHYTFISSISVFSDLSKSWIDESAPVGRLENETEEVNGETYGPLKALCEEAAEAAMPGRVWNVRPGLIVGPHDPTHRFTYWPARFARGGEILVPDVPEEPNQVIDVRDLAEWLVRGMEEKLTGVYNATGPDEPFTWRDLVDACTAVANEGSDAPAEPPAPTWVTEQFLEEKEVGAWMELPLWVPVSPDSVGFSRISIEKAKRDGLRFRPLEETVRDTLAWFRAQPARDWPGGLAPEKEAAVLEAWHAR
ncbi:MAG: NAD-dependent epimerase/dehydratase family protein [Candidatus Eisenbacteria bacterium]